MTITQAVEKIIPFGRGEVVWLKSGSPPLTVIDFQANGWLVCSWFAAAELKADAFPPQSLTSKKVSSSSGCPGCVRRREAKRLAQAKWRNKASAQ